MKINFTKKQFKTLLDLIFTGEYIINGIRLSDEAIEEYEELQQYIYSFAKAFGYEDLIEYNKEYGMFFETGEYDESGIHNLIEEYDDQVFWTELASNLAKRDISIEVGEREIEHEELMVKLWKREEEYNDEFYENGLDNVIIELNSKT